MAHEVFISYSSKDKHVADAICSFLESSKIRCWIAPRDITPGKEWGEEIINAISESKIMVLIFSESANASQQVLREVERAVNKNVIIIPFRIEDTEPTKSMEYFLYSTHWLDAIDSRLEKHIKRLKRTINKILSEVSNNKKRNQQRDKEDIVREIMEGESLKVYQPSQNALLKKVLSLALVGFVLAITSFLLYQNFTEEKDISQLYTVAEQQFAEANYEAGIKTYKEIADLGDKNVKNKLGDIYYHGLMAEQDKKEGLNWYKKAANVGSVEAKYSLAQIYHNGDLVAQDYDQAIELYQKVASYGNADAQYQLANFYESGTSIEQDYQKAVELYKLAAEQEHKDAQYMLAYMYISGRGVEENESRAKMWYEKAANAGNKDAQVALGAIYKYGLGVKTDLEKAESWYQQAAELGSEYAKNRLEKINLN